MESTYKFCVNSSLNKKKQKTPGSFSFCLMTFCVLLSGCRVSVSMDREAKDVKAQFHFLKVKKADDWQDISDKSLFLYGNDNRMRENDDKSFVFTLDKDTPPETITNWFFSTSLGKDVQGVEASVSFLSGLPGICGIYFPATPDVNEKNQECYFFGVNSIGQFALYYKPPIGDISAIVRAEQRECIQKGWDAENILTAYADGAKLVFLINGETVHIVEKAKLTEGRTGIFVRTRAKTDD